MADRIRARVWILGLAPIALIAVAGGVFLLAPRGGTVRPRAPVAAQEVETTAPNEPPPPAALPAAILTLTAQPAIATAAASAPPASAPAGSSEKLRGAPPAEPLPELDALYTRPRGSEEWTAEQKLDYRRKLLGDVAAKERSLRADVARAQRSGDRKTELEKQATLAYLVAHREQFERMLGEHDTLAPDAN